MQRRTERSRLTRRVPEKVIHEIIHMLPAPLLALSPLVERVGAALPDQEIYLVGGAVRDALLGHLSHDLDFVVPQNAIPIARHVADVLHADFYVLDEAFDTARVIVHSAQRPDDEDRNAVNSQNATRDFLDFSSFRRFQGIPAKDVNQEYQQGGSAQSAKRTTGTGNRSMGAGLYHQFHGV